MSIILPDEIHAPQPVFTGIVTKVTKVSPPPCQGFKDNKLESKATSPKKEEREVKFPKY